MRRFLVMSSAMVGVVLFACSSESVQRPNPGGDAGTPATISSTDPPPNRGPDPKPSTPTSPSDGGADVVQPPPSLGPPGTAADCDAFATPICAKNFGCHGSMVWLFADESACTAGLGEWCKQRLGATGSGFTHSALSACAQAASTETCDLVTSGALPAECHFTGAAADGAACSLDEQCKSGACSAPAEGCGTCRHVAAPGDACTSANDCGDTETFYCLENKCTLEPRAGESCAVSGGCYGLASCVGGVCKAPAEVGEPCDDDAVTAPKCDELLHLECSSTTKTCQAPSLAANGEPCWSSTPDWTECMPGSHCTFNGDLGTCQPNLPAGSPCGSGVGHCQEQMKCLANYCVYETAATCN